MSHKRNAFRFGIVLYWLTSLGVACDVATNSQNLKALGWQSLLLYGSGAAAVLYVGAVATKETWNIK